MRRHWQRRAHLVRQAIAGFPGFLDRAAMVRLAQRDDVESRIVIRTGHSWAVHHGPFRRRDFTGLPSTNWTLLVQGVNLHDERGAGLLEAFSFLPYARLDDLMVSYAAPGGGVGPHFDSYDVFLLQGSGRRRWRISAQDDLTLRENLPLRLLKRFRPDQEWILEPGDMLYLPPSHAHEGVALDECFTYSVGFRAPAFTELASQFLQDFADRLELPGRYEDAGAAPVTTPGRLPARLVEASCKALSRIRWTHGDVEAFLGRFLSEPKPQVFFDPPAHALSERELRHRLGRHSLRLHGKSLMIYSAHTVFLNGETYQFPRGVPPLLRELADRRAVQGTDLPSAMVALLREWHASGYAYFGPPDRRHANG